MATKIVAEYTGTEGAHLSSIPASDLTEDQMDALSEDQRTALLANAASEHAIYKLHGRDIKAEAKEVAMGETATISGDGSGEALPPFDPADPAKVHVAPARAQTAAKAEDKK